MMASWTMKSIHRDAETYLLPAHLFFLSLLLGTQIYQCILVNKVSRRSLSATAFRNLQCSLWPEYFYGQLIMGILLVLTMPASNSVFELVIGLGLLGVINMSAAVNWGFISPILIPNVREKAALDLLKLYARTGTTTRYGTIGGDDKAEHDVERKAKPDAVDPIVRSAELEKSNQRFHNASFWINWVTVVASLVYAFVFFGKLKMKS